MDRFDYDESHTEIFEDAVARDIHREAVVCHLVSRGELIEPTNYVSLTIQFRDGVGDPINTDVYPDVSIVSPTGLVIMSSSSRGVEQMGIGNYRYIFQAPVAGPFGVWNDQWSGQINGFLVEQTFSFVISHTDLPNINSDGKIHLGDDPGFQYDQASLFNINKCLKMVRARLKSSGKAKSHDSFGNVTYINCDIYSVELLADFLAMSLNKFNSTPYFTNFVWEDSHFFANFSQVIADGAVVYALASQALIERGREFQLTDNGIQFSPPTMAELLNTQYAATLAFHWDELKMIKASMRPHPLGLGVFGMQNGVNPAIKRLQGLRARRII